MKKIKIYLQLFVIVVIITAMVGLTYDDIMISNSYGIVDYNQQISDQKSNLWE
ncbi:MAG: hypothetical protein OEM28_08470 [Nitrosopumilus sp.]|nr:hypothetical protein [Nitrosopumilus sp.]MDH3487884.1 hypothetical protein [Nitrosopumilus sp.]